MPSYKLYYFDFHGGAGEPIRNAFRLAKVPFDDVRVNYADWPALKSSEKCLYGQMPILYPTDPIEALRVDEFLDCVIEFRSKMSSTYSLSEADKLAARKKIVDEFLINHYARIENRLSSHGGFTGFAVGSKLTIADLALANDVLGVRSGRLEGIDATVLDKYENVGKLVATVQKALAEVATN